MSIRVECENCGCEFHAAAESAGQRIACEICNHPVRVPGRPLEGPPEQSPGGSTIYRHQARERDFEPARGDGDTIDVISGHIERHLGEVGGVWHELVSDLVHIDVHVVHPTEKRPFYTLVTSGMSDRPMNAPEGAEECRFAELCLCLPPDWPLTQEAFEDERNYFPIRWLKFLARFPHEYETWLFHSHTVPHGDPPKPLAVNTKLCGFLLLPPIMAPEEFWKLEVDWQKTIHFFGVYLLYKEEMEFKLKQGVDPLIEKFAEFSVSELVDVRRKSVCKRGWWPFG